MTIRQLIFMLTCLTLLFLSGVEKGEASPPFDTIPTDKWAHFFASAYLTDYGRKHNSDGTVVLTVSAIGLGKEIYDTWIMKEPWDWGDIIADGLGMGLGLVIN